MKTKIIFMGTPLFASEVLATLLELEYIEVVAVVCQPDRKIGRKQIVNQSLVKQLAINNKIVVYQPENINSLVNELSSLKPEMLITCAYGQFLSTKILKIAPKGCLNIHASLLPTLRGGAPIQWAVINDLKFTGISLMATTLKMDAGPVYIQEKIALKDEETYSSLQLRLITLAKQMLKKYLSLIINGKIQPWIQDENKVTFGLNIRRIDEKIKWDQDAQKVICQIRGLFSEPLAYTIYEQQTYKIASAVVYDATKVESIPGTILNFLELGIEVQAKKGTILIKKLQPESKKMMDVKSFYQGNHRLKLQTKFD